ncbi:hypothetical protein AN958_05570 [Leucoagaricus sp. SymC.cos]|nr:hypothetical protein AN958_05570 [Leucoagaricus sp. SymC.cos]
MSNVNPIALASMGMGCPLAQITRFYHHTLSSSHVTLKAGNPADPQSSRPRSCLNQIRLSDHTAVPVTEENMLEMDNSRSSTSQKMS